MVTIDFLTGTFSAVSDIHGQWHDLMRDVGGTPLAAKPATHLGYMGTRVHLAEGTAFLGIHPERGAYAWVSGAAAHRIAPALALTDMAVTRLDLAGTFDILPADPGALIRRWHKIVEASTNDDWPHRRPFFNLNDSSTGQTLYCYRRATQRMLRAYTKTYTDPERPLLRVEWQCRHQLAVAYWQQYQAEGNAALLEAWRGECNGLPTAILDGIVLAARLPRPLPERTKVTMPASDVEKSLDWLHSTVSPVLARLRRAGAAADVSAWYDSVMEQSYKVPNKESDD